MSKDIAKGERFLRRLAPLQGALESYCRRLLRNASDVPDALQAALATAFRDFHLYVEGSNFRAWIFHYVHWEIQNCNRKFERTRHVDLPNDLSGADESVTVAADYDLAALLDDPEAVLDHCEDCLAQAVRELPFRERAVLLLQVFGEFKYREMSEILQAPIGTVMSTLARCRARLRHRLSQFGLERRLLQPAVGDFDKTKNGPA